MRDSPERFFSATYTDQLSKIIKVPEYDFVGSASPVFTAVIINRNYGSFKAGMYANRGGSRWVFCLPYEEVGTAFGGDYQVQILVNPASTVSLQAGTIVYRNGYYTTDAVQPGTRETVWVLLIPKPTGGGSSGGGSDSTYEHTQNSAYAVWSVNHNLNKYPSVATFDSAGDEIEGQVKHLNRNSLQIIFSASVGGSAFLN